MPYLLPALPYATDAFEPFISQETMELHYGRHHRGHLDKLNALIAGTDLENLALGELIRAMSTGRGAPQNRTRRAILDNAMQAWNHTFFWNCLIERARPAPGGQLARQLVSEFGSFDGFRRQFTETALALVGAGWIWLFARRDGSLGICTTANADTLCASSNAPLLVCDLWEHAYYLDRREDRESWLESFWQLANWDYAAANLVKAEQSLPAQTASVLQPVRPAPSTLYSRA